MKNFVITIPVDNHLKAKLQLISSRLRINISKVSESVYSGEIPVDIFKDLDVDFTMDIVDESIEIPQLEVMG